MKEVKAMSTREETGQEVLLDEQIADVEPPPFYRVLLLNDDFTPMDFVIVVLQRFFGMDMNRSREVMLKVHHEGKAICGVYPYDIAATKVEQVRAFANENQHPLQCVMEENR